MSQPDPRSNRITIAITVATIGLLCAFAAALWTVAPPAAPDVGEGATVLPVPLEIPDFSLTDHRGEPFDRGRLEGSWSLLFFGYTYCPDICPLTLQSLAPVQDLLAREPRTQAAAVQVVFVSVDPERDPVGRMNEYVAFFHPDLIGATGESEQLERLTQAVGAHSRRSEPEAEGSGYLVDHAASLFLVDPRARLVALLNDPHDPEEFVELLARVQKARKEMP